MAESDKERELPWRRDKTLDTRTVAERKLKRRVYFTRGEERGERRKEKRERRERGEERGGERGEKFRTTA